MKKKWTALAVIVMAASLTACSARPAASPSHAPIDQTASGTTYTGTLQEKNDFMIVVGEDGADGKPGVSYVFNINDDVKVDAKVGDQVTVTYTGDLNDIDSRLEATQVDSAS